MTFVNPTPDARRLPMKAVRNPMLEGASREASVNCQPAPGTSNQGSIYPTLRANPSPKVTDLFCRLSLSTLFYQLEALHLGDLLRL